MRNAYEVALEFVTEQASVDADLKEKARALADLICTERDVLKNRIADMINDFSWIIPFYDDARINEASDDAVCSVQDQIVRAILAIS
jgi:hypothetical protein